MLLPRVPTLRSTPSRRRGLPPGTGRRGALLACLLTAIAAPAAGQSSRADVITQQEAAKAKKLTPPAPNKAEALVAKIQDIMLENPSGFYPYFDSVYSGGGFTLGAGYRQFRGDNTHLRPQGPLLDQELQARRDYGTPRCGSRRRQGQPRRARSAGVTRPRSPTTALGIDTPVADRSNYRFKQG